MDNKIDIIPILGKFIYSKQLSFIDEVITSESEVCLKLNETFVVKDLYTLVNFCIDNVIVENLNTSEFGVTYSLPVCYETGSDWELIEKNCNLPKEQFIQEITEIEFSLVMFGFLPGFLYLNGLPKKLHCKRKATPTKNIAPNTLAIGAQYLGLYSIPSPAGWNIIGNTAFNVNNIPNLPPNLLNIGDKIKLKRIDESEFREIKEQKVNIISYNAQN